jgi:hypothetical protein
VKEIVQSLKKLNKGAKDAANHADRKCRDDELISTEASANVARVHFR